AKGATRQRCLWASTSTKNPEYRDVMYVEELIGPETVNTMPIETIRAFQDHGEIRGDTIEEGLDEAHALLEELKKAGIDYDDVVDTLEREGVQKFSDSLAELLEGINAKKGGPVSGWWREPPSPSSSSGSGAATRASGPATARGSGSAGSTSL